jgi:methoxymalonate biosynthesis protein
MSVTDRIAVIGAGVMGTSITAMVIGHGVPAILVDIEWNTLERARNTIDQYLRHARMMGALPAGRTAAEVVLSRSIDEIAGVSAVIEAVTEEPELKAKVLGEALSALTPGTPMITNTSGIPVDELAGRLDRPGELVGAHFMNPAYLIKMVEVIEGPRTTSTTITEVKRLLALLDRQVIEVRDAPGFVTSRLLHPMLNAAIGIVEAGTATVDAVDRLMQGCLGHPLGPLRTADLIGLDNLADSLAALYERTGDEGCRPRRLLLDKIRDGELGRKSGRGFYDYGKATQ